MPVRLSMYACLRVRTRVFGPDHIYTQRERTKRNREVNSVRRLPVVYADAPSFTGFAKSVEGSL